MNVKDLTLTGSLLLLAAASLPSTAHAQGSGLPWVTTWAEAPATISLSQATTGNLSFAQQTIRQVVHTSAGGNVARIHLSNRFGNAPLTIADLHIAASPSNASPNINAQTDRVITFSGATTVTIPVGQEVVSDTIAFTVPAQGDVAISMYLPGTTPLTVTTAHYFTYADSWYTSGDLSASATLPASNLINQHYFLTGLDTQNTALTGTLVTMGASITEGMHSSNLANHRWPNYLATIFANNGINIGISNAGISGDGMLGAGDIGGIYGISAPNRYSVDVLQQPAVRWTIFSDFPINDLDGSTPPPTADQFISGYQSLIAETHAQGVKFYCSTLTPYQGYSAWSQAREDVREAVNAWLITAASGCDAIVDFAAVIADPGNPEAILPAYDSGDHLHPNDAGYQAMASKINLGLFMSSTALPAVVAPTGCGSLTAGHGLSAGAELDSCDKRFRLILQTDGNMVIYEGNTPLWTSGTYQKASAEAVLNNYGNFVIYDVNGQPIWATNSDNNPNATFVMQNDGNLVMYTTAGQPVWNTYTNGH